MSNKTNPDQTNSNSNDKPKAELPKVSLATRAKSILGKTPKVISSLIVMGSLFVGAVVSERLLSVVESSDCGISVNFKSSPSSPLDFKLNKEACSKPPER